MRSLQYFLLTFFVITLGATTLGVPFHGHYLPFKMLGFFIENASLFSGMSAISLIFFWLIEEVHQRQSTENPESQD